MIKTSEDIGMTMEGCYLRAALTFLTMHYPKLTVEDILDMLGGRVHVMGLDRELHNKGKE